MPATQAQAQMDPPVAHLQAFFTTLGMRFHVFDLIEMSAFGHLDSPSCTRCVDRYRLRVVALEVSELSEGRQKSYFDTSATGSHTSNRVSPGLDLT
jgi:hypothetical protein